MSAPTAPTGLTSAEVAERTTAGAVNRVRRSDAAEYLDILARNVATLFNALVVPAAIALFALGDYKAGLAVSGMAVTNTLLGLVQEVRAKWILDQLTLLTEARVRVLRDGAEQEIPSGDVVQGDLVLLTAGDSVVADGPVVESRFLEVDEALLTGESDPVPRKPGDQVLSGSFAVTGEGSYIAEKVGLASFAQRTASEARSYRYTSSPLQQSIDRLIRILTALAVLLCAGYVALYFLRDSIGKDDLVRMVAATITLMVPQGLVLMTTLAFILGALRMSAQGALVQRINAVEAMASIDVLCMDKTGTLTTNRLKLERAVPLGGLTEEVAKQKLRLFASLSLDRGSKSLQAVRVALGEEKGELLDQLPFKSQNRYSAVRVRAGGSGHTLVLGACEALKPFLVDSSWEQAWRSLLGSGLRLLLLAEPVPDQPPPRERFEGSLEGFSLHPVALVALSDELRPEAAGVLRDLAGQGISFKILSGDNAETVQATVAPLGKQTDEPALRALAEEPVVSGAQLEKAEAPGEVIRTHSVFGRVSPWQKVEVVTTLKAQGRQVAMIGDGVNDVLPIKNAQLGIAMGDGARASKTVAGLVLQNNDFGLLPQVLDEGRTIVRNLRRAGKLFLTKNAYILLLIVATVGIFRLAFPLLPQQVTLLNFLTIGIPALLITLGRERSRALRTDFVTEVGSFALRTGVIIGLAALAIMLLSARVWHDDVPTQRTLVLAVLVLLGLTTLLRALRDGEAGTLSGDRIFYRWMGAAVVLFAGALYLHPIASFFELTPLPPVDWLRVLAVVVPAVAALFASDYLLGARRTAVR